MPRATSQPVSKTPYVNLQVATLPLHRPGGWAQGFGGAWSAARAGPQTLGRPPLVRDCVVITPPAKTGPATNQSNDRPVQPPKHRPSLASQTFNNRCTMAGPPVNRIPLSPPLLCLFVLFALVVSSSGSEHLSAVSAKTKNPDTPHDRFPCSASPYEFVLLAWSRGPNS